MGFRRRERNSLEAAALYLEIFDFSIFILPIFQHTFMKI